MPALSRHWLVSCDCMKAFFPVSSGQVVGFCQWWWVQRLFVVSYRPLVEPLRLFHPTVLLSVLKRAEQKTGNAPVSLSFRAGLSLTAMGEAEPMCWFGRSELLDRLRYPHLALNPCPEVVNGFIPGYFVRGRACRMKITVYNDRKLINCCIN